MLPWSDFFFIKWMQSSRTYLGLERKNVKIFRMQNNGCMIKARLPQAWGDKMAKCVLYIFISHQFARKCSFHFLRRDTPDFFTLSSGFILASRIQEQNICQNRPARGPKKDSLEFFQSTLKLSFFPWLTSWLKPLCYYPTLITSPSP